MSGFLYVDICSLQDPDEVGPGLFGPNSPLVEPDAGRSGRLRQQINVLKGAKMAVELVPRYIKHIRSAAL
jgi:hypothetical protein